MTGITTKPGQKRLDSCVLALPKWPKIREKLGKHTCGTLKIDDLIPDTAVRVENLNGNLQDPFKPKLLGQYRSKQSLSPLWSSIGYET